MKKLYASLFVFIASQLVSVADGDRRIKLEGVQSVHQMTGYLNKPFGSIVNVTGKVKLFPAVKDGRKARQERYFVVTHIEGRKIDAPITFDLWLQSLPDAKHGDLITAKAYERLMMLGTPKAARSGIGFSGTAKQIDFRLWRYIHILPDK